MKRKTRHVSQAVGLIVALLAPQVMTAQEAAAAAENCHVDEGQAAVSLTVENITDDQGNIRAQIYSNNPDEFLEKGKKLVRVETPAQQGNTHLCVPVPAPGEYALVVMHDMNENGKADIFSEGFGFSNNPALGLGKPDHSKVVFTVPEGITETKVKLKYLLGSGDEKEKRSARRRR